MSRLVPKLRFKEFSGEWEDGTLEGISEIVRGGSPRPIDKYMTLDKDALNWLKIADVDKNSKYVTFTKERVKKTALSKTREVHPNDLILSNSMSFGRPYIMKIKSCIHDGWIAVTNILKDINTHYLYYIILSPISQKFFVDYAAGGGIRNLNADIIKSLPVSFSKDPKEQQKIASCLSSLDALIEAQNKKVSVLKQHKKGLMQQLFPAEGEREPKLRFKAFSGEWVEKKLGECLGYLQPTKYLVSDTNYNDDYDTPVLTAGKTFILGYTNEKSGIFKNNLPVIIFDDFTTATKYVDFPFKAKSSAMKILLAKESMNIKFMYELMQMIKYEVGNHERHWISKFALLDVLIPTPKEQQKIANTLSTLDNLIEAQDQKITQLKQHKKGLMQQLFVSSEVAHE
ncbi:Type I restriction-modification system, specificity subunit S (EC [uncultured Gammaproteobacteria bacterium]|nr:Type I restriction-modification system, specificity subunit S (EC [uncultured Gammaproteobacteria bacterium]